ncbi:unnamed protein product [Amaranthus hypochondriacus]
MLQSLVFNFRWLDEEFGRRKESIRLVNNIKRAVSCIHLLLMLGGMGLHRYILVESLRQGGLLGDSFCKRRSTNYSTNSWLIRC